MLFRSEENYSAELAKALVDDNPRAIVNGLPLPYSPNPVMKS